MAAVVAHRAGRLARGGAGLSGPLDTPTPTNTPITWTHNRVPLNPIMTVAEAAEREALLALLAAAFPATLTLNRSVSANALVAAWGNRYSVPPELAGANVRVTHRCGTNSRQDPPRHGESPALRRNRVSPLPTKVTAAGRPTTGRLKTARPRNL